MAVIAGALILATTACGVSSDNGKKEAASTDSAAETAAGNRGTDSSELVFELSGDSVKLTSGDEPESRGRERAGMDVDRSRL